MALGISQRRDLMSKLSELEEIQLNINWEDVICPICLDFPHNGVLLKCSSYDKGCRPFICDTDNTHSNCLDRFKAANGLSKEIIQANSSSSDSHMTCPLCRGEVTGWVIIDEARVHLNMKRRFCEEKHCSYIGNYMELQKHAMLKHPYARPSEIDPARQLEWENFQQSEEIIDVLSTIHAEVPHGVVMGDFVIEYGDEDMAADYEVRRVRGSWWTSCIFYKAFKNFRTSRDRRRLRARERRSSRHRSSSSSSNMEEGSTTSPEFSMHRYDGTDDEFVGSGYSAVSRWNEDHDGYWRRRRTSRFNDD